MTIKGEEGEAPPAPRSGRHDSHSQMEPVVHPMGELDSLLGENNDRCPAKKIKHFKNL